MFIVAAFVAVGAAAAGAATVLAVATLVSYVGIAMTLVGMVTGSQKLLKWGGILSLAGTVVGFAAKATIGAATNALAEGAAGKVVEGATTDAVLGGASGSAVPYLGAEGVGTVAETSFGTLAGEQAAAEAAGRIGALERAMPGAGLEAPASSFATPAEAFAAPARAPLLGTELSAGTGYDSPFTNMAPTTVLDGSVVNPYASPAYASPTYMVGENAAGDFSAGRAALAAQTGAIAPPAITPGATAPVAVAKVAAAPVGTASEIAAQKVIADKAAYAALSPFEKFSTFAKENKDLLSIGTQVAGGVFTGMNRTAEFNEYAALRNREMDMRKYGNTTSRFQPRGLIGGTA